MAIPCKFHPGCSQPCPIEAALHLEIRAEMSNLNPKQREVQRRGGQKGGYRANQQKFVGKAPRLKNSSNPVPWRFTRRPAPQEPVAK